MVGWALASKGCPETPLLQSITHNFLSLIAHFHGEKLGAGFGQDLIQIDESHRAHRSRWPLQICIDYS
jgi:hypothetical protein